ncbi:MAG: hypothetical protein F3745_10330 [Nitrospinae bacterium]|nr:hypothetical protein [Nitrospinota bacterium]
MEYTAFSKYLKLVVRVSSFLLIAVASVNYTIDPSAIYKSPLSYIHESPLLKAEGHKKFESDNHYTLELSFINQLVNSDHGLSFPTGFNERRFKHTLALYPTTAECAVIGSSHVMQLSSARQQKSLTHTCLSILNLGVSGASLEDYIALSEIILQNKRPPETIIFGIDPWALNFLRDKRYLQYSLEYENMLSKLVTAQSDSYGDDLFDTSLLRNLFNREYFMESVRYILSQFKEELPKEELPKEELPKEELPKYRNVYLSDGSLIYSKEYSKKMQNYKMNGVDTYKIEEHHYYEKKAIELFTRLVLHLQQKHNVIFLLTPYHPAVWKLGDQPVVKAMKLVESKVHLIAKSVRGQVIGSYNPNRIGCNADEFFDEQHPAATCLAKLETISSQY